MFNLNQRLFCFDVDPTVEAVSSAIALAEDLSLTPLG
jgi:hypothetical protein